ncbi:MAG: glycerol-3-phosphate dehydrogenase [Oceanospirillales bacterium]|nr:MAG: glycerol-3-phosphate dehydrogenase [Oceanospirillales bacterium]
MYDLLVIGGGVNGTGIAMDAAGRGLKVALCEMADLGGATSSNSSKLIHGGLRYLEHYEFGLVKKALAEREILLNNAPHIMWPLRFILPHRPHLRPAWMIRVGLFLYDNLAKRQTLRPSDTVKFDQHSPLKSQINKGFIYSDVWVDDARLVLLCALAAQERGAKILTRTQVTKAQRIDGLWSVTLTNVLTGKTQWVKAKGLVNAAGPWVSRLFSDALSVKAPKEIRLVKGSHIVVPRIYMGEEAYILQNEDERIVFVIPYEEKFSLIGTTDVEFNGNPREAKISDEETDYLISVVNAHFKKQLSVDDVVWTFSGVRPLMDDEVEDAKKASRDYSFQIDSVAGQAPLLSVFGGKLTTYRKLAEAATNAMCKFFPGSGQSWTQTAKLPGADFIDQQQLFSSLKLEFPWIPPSLLTRYIRSYGTLVKNFLQGVHSVADLGQHFGSELYQAEVDYLIKHEWVVELDDLIWRRTKLGLVLSDSEKQNLASYLECQLKKENQGNSAII